MKEKGQGTLVFLVLVVIALLFIFSFLQNLLSGVNSSHELAWSGRQALYIAESAITEALLDFKRQMNVPSADPNSWFRLLRRPLVRGYNGFEEKTFDPVISKTLHDDTGVLVDKVTVSLWMQRSFAKNEYEKSALLTLTAVVRIPRRMPGLFGRYVTRNVQKSYELKHVLITPPRPFDIFTMFFRKFPYLPRAARYYDDYRGNFDQRGRDACDQLNNAIDYWHGVVKRRVNSAKGELNRINSQLAAAPAAIRGQVRASIEKGLRKRGLSFDLLERMAKTDPDAWTARVGYRVELDEADWPRFRTDGRALTNYVYIDKKLVKSTELRLSLPEWPDLPGDPSEFVPADANSWDWPDLRVLSRPFLDFIQTYNESIPPFVEKARGELRRHQDLLHLVDEKFMKVFDEHYLPKTQAWHWRRRASWEFPDEDIFKSSLDRADGAVWLDGIYYIDGPVDVDFANYRGYGVIVAKGKMHVAGCSPAADAGLVLVSAEEIVADSSVRAALISPRGGVKFSGNTVYGNSCEYGHSGDDFTVKYDDALWSMKNRKERLEKFWVTVCPYETALNFVRK